MIRKDGKQYLTVKEYSELANISKQAVYQQLKNRLLDFTIEVESQTYINAAALDKFYPQGHTSELEQLEQAQLESVRQNDRKQIEQLESIIDLLRSELEQKNKQIENLDSRLQEALRSVNQEQQLHLVTQNKLQLIEQKEEKEEKSKVEAENKNKKGLFSLFRKGE